MGAADTLLWGAMIIGGGYILFYHVLPGLVQQGAGEFLQGFERGFAQSGGQFLPTTGQTRCWEIGDGTRACSCQGKQYTKMGKLRPCEDCYQMCGGGGLPDRGRPTNNPTPPKATNPSPSGCTVQQFSTNCLRNTSCQYCWYSTGKSACTNVQSCQAARSTWLARWSSGPTNVPPTRPTTGPASGKQETYNCTVISTGAVGKRWQCRGAKSGRVVLQGPAWTCFGATAQSRAVGATCTVIS